ncbi:hypothetical protein Ddye_004924 [Dipteronia dyeriana]|uniref:Reverse transcriptase zinc-binding domain-containing protein n=1 Tax=Dipteronia dyeriana TaxID=168575 RepID=A0AAE0CP80_9ROSI|nr:hypothetical protein Ddye_004924 [Dipteronia dyeriana]
MGMSRNRWNLDVELAKVVGKGGALGCFYYDKVPKGGGSFVLGSWNLSKEVAKVDCGSKLFRFLNGWSEDRVLIDGVRKNWMGFSVRGHAGLNIKQKIKTVKLHMKAHFKERKSDGSLIKELEEEMVGIEFLVVFKVMNTVIGPSQMAFVKDRQIVDSFIIAKEINFQKSCLVQIGKKVFSEEDWVAAFRCASTSLPVTYLGLPLRGNSRRETFWNSDVSKVEQRLAQWKRAFITKCGCLVLIKAVLTSGPSHFMKCLEVNSDSADLFYDFLWHDLCPPKVEVFVWQQLKGRVLVRKVLLKFGVVVQMASSGCPMCDGVVLNSCFFVDGSSRGNSRDARLGGVLQDYAWHGAMVKIVGI